MKKVGTLYREAITSHVKDNTGERNVTFLLSYTGVSGLQMSTLRKDLKRVGAQLYVSKNSLTKRALKDLDYGILSESVEGQTALVFSDEKSVEIAKILKDFSKDCEGVVVQGGLLQKDILTKDKIKQLADLPSREVLLAMLIGTIQSPLTRLAGALSGKIRELMYLLKQISEQKGGK